MYHKYTILFENLIRLKNKSNYNIKNSKKEGLDEKEFCFKDYSIAVSFGYG